MATNHETVAVVAGGVLGGALLGYAHVFVLAYMALVVSTWGFKHIGGWAFLLNGTASAMLSALIVGMPLGALVPRMAVRIAVVMGGMAAILLAYFGSVTAGAQWWWVPLTDALQLPLFFCLSAWLGSRLWNGAERP